MAISTEQPRILRLLAATVTSAGAALFGLAAGVFLSRPDVTGALVFCLLVVGVILLAAGVALNIWLFIIEGRVERAVEQNDNARRIEDSTDKVRQCFRELCANLDMYRPDWQTTFDNLVWRASPTDPLCEWEPSNKQEEDGLVYVSDITNERSAWAVAIHSARGPLIPLLRSWATWHKEATDKQREELEIALLPFIRDLRTPLVIVLYLEIARAKRLQQRGAPESWVRLGSQWKHILAAPKSSA